MSWPYLHTLVNHFPIILTVVGALAVLLAAMYGRRGVWTYALWSLLLAGLTIYPAWLTGGRAGGAVRNAWYIERGAVHTHAAAADITLWIVAGTGLLALVALITLARTRDAVSPARWLRVLVGLGALASICAVSYTGFLGGKIVVESPILASPAPPVITAPNAGMIPGTSPPTTPGAGPAPAAQPPVAPPVSPYANPTQPQPQPQTQLRPQSVRPQAAQPQPHPPAL
jgi:hypothetical protein